MRRLAAACWTWMKRGLRRNPRRRLDFPAHLEQALERIEPVALRVRSVERAMAARGEAEPVSSIPSCSHSNRFFGTA